MTDKPGSTDSMGIDALLDSMTATIVILDKLGTITRVNQAWSHFALENEASASVLTPTDQNYLEVCSRADGPGAKEAAQCLEGLKALQAGVIDHFEMEYPCDSATEERWFLMRAVPLKTEAGGLVISHIDLTSHKQSAETNRQQREQLTHAQRASALGDISAALVHEINQPLTAVLMNAQVLRRSLASEQFDRQEAREIVDDIINDNMRTSKIMERTRSLLKQSPFESVPLSINEIVESVADILHYEASMKKVPLTFDLQRGLQQVLGDLIQLQQVIMNLLLNAFDAVQTQSEEERSILLQTTRHGDNSICISIQDNGVGFAQENTENVFAPFHTTKAKGLGMGLSICRTIVEAHGGLIWARENPHGGAIFEFTIPTISAHTPAVTDSYLN